ncbi:hypothetical protein [Ramlibacter sp.]|uniref:hypothetical protein n=1 Tax=Ramlibacter sp. TaxID=1917967 RepID=UPI002C93D683|nr:hypothetical protein [Ramlibacter sp.]HWI81468.1 hypothetical protein [Ramlibacter sp.]
MGMPLFAANALFSRLQRLAGALARSIRASADLPPAHRPASLPGATTSMPAVAPAVAPVRSLRVVRVVEASPAAASAGRMVISGRMADVCAELERLAALEAAAG